MKKIILGSVLVLSSLSLTACSVNRPYTPGYNNGHVYSVDYWGNGPYWGGGNYWGSNGWHKYYKTNYGFRNMWYGHGMHFDRAWHKDNWIGGYWKAGYWHDTFDDHIKYGPGGAWKYR